MGSVRLTRCAAVAAATAVICSAAALPAYGIDDFGESDGPDTRSESVEEEFDDPGGRSETVEEEFDDPGGTLGTAKEFERPGAKSGRVKVTPSVVRPGGEVDLRVDGCKGTTGTARSEAFVADAELAPAADRGELFAEATVATRTAPGTYTITVECDGHAKGTLTVLGTHATPTAPVRAGGGGTAVAATDRDGPGAAHVLVGLGLAVGAGLGVAGIAVRRRRSGSAASEAAAGPAGE
jgi:hypothetical protein